MGNQKTCFAFILFFMCWLVYFINYTLNLSNKDSAIPYHVKQSITKVIATPSSIFPEVTESCPKEFTLKNISILRSKNWQKLNNQSTLHLLSAYIDNRRTEETFLRIVAMSKGKFSQRIFCRVWYQNIRSSVTEIEVQELWITSWDYATPEQYYRPLLLSCPCRTTSTPVAVSIINKPCLEPNNLFWLTSIKQLPKQDFAICLKPLQFQKDITSRLLEWLELQLILGVDAISVYQYHLQPQTIRVLDMYIKSGKLSVHSYSPPGDNPLVSNVRQKRRHEMVIYNDCFYRHIHTHWFVVNLDLDEAIIPLIHDNWKDLLDHAMHEDSRLLRSASMSAQNVYFFDSFPADASVPNHFHMLRHQYRSANFTPPGFAQKSFFSTNLTLIVSNHYALRSLYPGKRTNSALGKDLAQLHHYRAGCPSKMDKECEENYMKFRVKDPVILKFSKKLMKNVQLRIQELNVSVDS